MSFNGSTQTPVNAATASYWPSETPVKAQRRAGLFTLTGMSSRSTPDEVAGRLAGHIGIMIAEARRGRNWSLRELARRAGVSTATIHAVEHGSRASLEVYAAIADALDLELNLALIDPRKRATVRAEDPVHAAMGEMIAARMAGHGFRVAIDEPYQHYQFAGRADVLAWDLSSRALLHVENRTRFPNLQDAIGSYNAKRAYLPGVVAERLGVRGFATVTNVIAGLWSSEVIHAARIRAATFRSVCPDDRSAFEGWWAGAPPTGRPTSAFVLLDPVSTTRWTSFAGLEQVLEGSIRPRYLGYADAATALRGTRST
jgi:ribosome-binding protein aMBF1 (putative translation factor)